MAANIRNLIVSILTGSGEWMPMDDLYAEVVEQGGEVTRSGLRKALYRLRDAGEKIDQNVDPLNARSIRIRMRRSKLLAQSGTVSRQSEDALPAGVTVKEFRELQKAVGELASTVGELRKQLARSASPAATTTGRRADPARTTKPKPPTNGTTAEAAERANRLRETLSKEWEPLGAVRERLGQADNRNFGRDWLIPAEAMKLVETRGNGKAKQVRRKS